MIFFLIKLVLLAVFNVSFFSITKGACDVSLWVSYGFVLFAFLNIFLSPLFVKKVKGSSHLFVQNISLILTVYFVLTLAAGFFFLFNPEFVLFQYAAEATVTGIYLIFLLLNIFVNSKIAGSQESIAADREFLNGISVKMQVLFSKAENENVKKESQKLIEEIKYSPVKSCAQAKEIENALSAKINEASVSDSAEQTVKILSECSQLLAERNLVLKKNQ